MAREWEKTKLENLGDYVGQAILIICDDGSFEGGLKGFSETDILIEIAEGDVCAVSRDVLQGDFTELYVLEETP